MSVLRQTTLAAMPADVVETILSWFSVPSLVAARLVCRDWAALGHRDGVLIAAVQASGSISAAQLLRLVPLTPSDLCSLPRRPCITPRGRIIWRYGPKAVRAGQALVRASGVSLTSLRVPSGSAWARSA